LVPGPRNVSNFVTHSCHSFRKSPCGLREIREGRNEEEEEEGEEEKEKASEVCEQIPLIRYKQVYISTI
jgi:hypothetical protein